MLIYPEYPLPDIPVNMEMMYNYVKNSKSFNFSYKRRLSFRRKRVFTLNYKYLNKEEISILQNFYDEVMTLGDGNFYYITHSTYSLNNEYVLKYIGQQDNTYDLPLYSGEDIKIFCNFVDITDYCTIYYDYPKYKVTINYNLSLGDLITCNFKNGRLILLCEFDNNSIGVEHIQAGLSNIKDLKLIEVLNT